MEKLKVVFGGVAETLGLVLIRGLLRVETRVAGCRTVREPATVVDRPRRRPVAGLTFDEITFRTATRSEALSTSAPGLL